MDKNIHDVVRNGEFEKVLNNEILHELTTKINYNEKEKYSTQQKLILEIQMKLLDMLQNVL